VTLLLLRQLSAIMDVPNGSDIWENPPITACLLAASTAVQFRNAAKLLFLYALTAIVGLLEPLLTTVQVDELTDTPSNKTRKRRDKESPILSPAQDGRLRHDWPIGINIHCDGNAFSYWFQEYSLMFLL